MRTEREIMKMKRNGNYQRADKIIPTTILTGFLGAGKTTYLNHILKSKPDTRFAIIENEFGEESIDGDLIVRSSDDIVEMNNGCLCCTLNENLYELLNELYTRADEFDELIIEATGVADPAGISEPFLIHPAVKKRFQLHHVICLIDAERIEDQLKETEEARKQITFSNILLLNKTDLVIDGYVDELKQSLQGINPTAEVVVKEKDTYPLFMSESLSFQLNNSTDNHSKEGKYDHHHDSNQHDDSGKATTHQHTDIVTHSFVYDDPIDIKLLYNQLFAYLTFQAKDIYRVKGIVYSDDEKQKYLLQSVGNRLGLELFGEWKDGEKKKSKIVFIGKNLKWKGVQRLIERCIKRPL